MAAGVRPFQGGSSAALMASILRDSPRGIGEVRSDLPLELARLIDRCLEKHPDDRVQTSRDVYNELRAVSDRARASAGTGGSISAGDTPRAGSGWRSCPLRTAALIRMSRRSPRA